MLRAPDVPSILPGEKTPMNKTEGNVCPHGAHTG